MSSLTAESASTVFRKRVRIPTRRVRGIRPLAGRSLRVNPSQSCSRMVPQHLGHGT